MELELMEWHQKVLSGDISRDDPRFTDLRFLKSYMAFAKKQRRPKLFYRYMVTFTLRSLPEDEDVIEGYIISQFHRAPLQVVEAHISKEYTQTGVPHWHVVVTTRKCLKKDRFHYYIKKYGNIDISRTKAQTLDEGLNYINKSSSSKQFI